MSWVSLEFSSTTLSSSKIFVFVINFLSLQLIFIFHSYFMLGTCQYIQVFWVEQWRKFFQAIMPINSCFLSWTMVEIFYKTSSVLRCVHLVQFTLILLLLDSTGHQKFSVCQFFGNLSDWKSFVRHSKKIQNIWESTEITVVLVIILVHNNIFIHCPLRCSSACCAMLCSHP